MVQFGTERSPEALRSYRGDQRPRLETSTLHLSYSLLATTWWAPPCIERTLLQSLSGPATQDFPPDSIFLLPFLLLILLLPRFYTEQWMTSPDQIPTSPLDLKVLRTKFEEAVRRHLLAEVANYFLLSPPTPPPGALRCPPLWRPGLLPGGRCLPERTHQAWQLGQTQELLYRTQGQSGP